MSADTGGEPGSGGAGDGQAGEQGCVQSNGTCACNWNAPSCEADKNLYTGQGCPPTFDEIRQVANWPLGGPPMPGSHRLTGEYEECDDGSRAFVFWQCDDFYGFIFDARGQLLNWTENQQFCAVRVCGVAPATGGSCRICELRSDPPGEGMSCFPRGMNNGPTPSCMADANGHWLMPPLCDD